MISPLKLFFTIFTPILIAMVILYLSVIEITKDIQYKDANRYLQDNFKIVAQLIDNGGLKSAENILDKISKSTSTRITIINNSGKVIYDSSVATDNLSSLDNHALREEVRNATLDEGYSSLRRSISTGVESIYFAKKVNKDLTLRLAYNTKAMNDIVAGNYNNLLTAFIFLLMILMFISIIIANKISTPIKQLNSLYDQIKGSKDINVVTELNDKTLSKIASLIYQINLGLKRQNKNLDNEHNKLESIISIMREGIILIDRDGSVLRFNESAKLLLGVDLQVNQNLFFEINDIRLISFFADIKTVKEESVSQVDIGGRVLHRYIKTMGNETLIVFSDTTDIANYSEYKNSLLSNITHELKTPLSLIIGASETILSDSDMKDEQRKRFLEQINKHANRLNNIINDSIELYRLESEGQFNYIDKATDIDELIGEIKTLGDSSDIKHELIFDTELKSINIRFADIFSIVLNLVDNAKKYSNGSKIYISIKRQNDSKIIIKVEDSDGNIIPKEERERIFERFYTISKSRSKDRSGTGLGLAIVKHITMQYLGKILIYENQYKGNTFEVILREKAVKEV